MTGATKILHSLSCRYNCSDTKPCASVSISVPRKRTLSSPKGICFKKFSGGDTPGTPIKRGGMAGGKGIMGEARRYQGGEGEWERMEGEEGREGTKMEPREETRLRAGTQDQGIHLHAEVVSIY